MTAAAAAAAPDDPAETGGGLRGFGGFSVAGMPLALPMQALREVVPAGPLQMLPCAQPAVVGALPLRGVLVPVLDLRRLLGCDTQAPCPIVILLVEGGRMLGLLAESVTGVFPPAEGGLLPVSATVAGAHPTLWAGSLRRGDDGTLVSLLSPAALAALPGVPMLDDPEPERQAVLLAEAVDGAANGAARDAGAEAAGVPGLDADTLPMMLMRCGGVALALDAMQVHATVADPRIEPSVLRQGHCLGVIEHGGQKVPALDLLSVAGLGRHDPQDARQAFLLRRPEGDVAVLIGEVVDVVRVRRDALLPLPALARPRAGLYAGALPLHALPPEAVPRARQIGGSYLVLDGAALVDSAEVTALARTHRQVGASASAGLGAARAAAAAGAAASPGAALRGGFGAAVGAGRRAMVCYGLDTETATPIEQISEILPLDPASASFQGTGTLLGVVLVRGQAVPLVCLSGLLGLPPPAASPAVSVLVVDSAGERIGFAVPRLLTIESAAWEPVLGALGGAERGDPLRAALSSGRLAQMGEGPQRRMVRVLELQKVAEALQAQADPQACAA